MKPRNVSVSAHDYQQDCYVTVTFKLPVALARDENGIVTRTDRNRIQKEIEKVISNVDMSDVKAVDQLYTDQKYTELPGGLKIPMKEGK